MHDVDGRMVPDAAVPLDVKLTVVSAVTDDVTFAEVVLSVEVIVEVILPLDDGSSVHEVEGAVVLLVQENVVVSMIVEDTGPVPVKLEEMLVSLIPVPVPKEDVVLGTTEEELLMEVGATIVELEMSVQ